MRYHVTLKHQTFVVDVDADGVKVDGVEVACELRPVGSTGVHGLVLDGAVHRVVAREEPQGRWSLVVDGRTARADVVDERTRAIRVLAAARGLASGPKPLRAPMPGLVVKVEVQEGDTVVEGQGLVIVEAMKMENELRAEVPARIGRILVEPGQAVEKDQILVELLAAGSEGEEEES